MRRKPIGARRRAAQPAPESLGDARWWTVFQDPQLQELIRVALQQNFDMRIAATRVLQAQARVGHHSRRPISFGQRWRRLHRAASCKDFEHPSRLRNEYRRTGFVRSLESRFWGKYRKATEAARASLLASEWGRRAVLDSVISNVATAYFQLRAMDLQLEIRKTRSSRAGILCASLQVLARNGSASDLDVRQAEQLVYTASETIPDLERQIQQQENVIVFSSAGIPVPSLAAFNHRRTKTAERSAGPSLRASRAPPGMSEAEENLVAERMRKSE